MLVLIHHPLASYLLVIPPQQRITVKDRLLLNLSIGKFFQTISFVSKIDGYYHRQRFWTRFSCRC